MNKKPPIFQQKTNEWCHICGHTKEYLCEIIFPEPSRNNQYVDYVRICICCAMTALNTARGPYPGDEAMKEKPCST